MDKNEFLLWRYIDGQLSAKEKNDVEKRLKTDSTLDLLYQEILLFDSELKTTQLREADQVNLVEKTIQKITSEEIRQSSNSSINLLPVGVFVTFLVTLSVLLHYSGIEGSKYDKSFTNYLSDLDIYNSILGWVVNLPLSNAIIILMIALPALLAFDNFIASKQKATFVF